MELSNNEMSSFQPNEELAKQRTELAEQIAVANSQGNSDFAEILQERLNKLETSE